MPENVLHIVEPERYEVNAKNRAWNPGEAKRAGPLNHYRSKVNGHAWGRGYRKMLTVAGRPRAAFVFGVFHKLLELGADEDAEYRWFILDGDKKPLDTRGMAREIGFSEKHIATAIEVLADPAVRRLEWVPWGDNSGECPGKPGNSPSETETETETETDISGAAPPQGTSPPCPLHAICAAWNKEARGAGLPEVRRRMIPKGRERKLRIRWEEPLFRENYLAVFAACAKTPFLCGKNDRGWRADLDWILANDTNYTKVLEGKYDRGRGTGPVATDEEHKNGW